MFMLFLSSIRQRKIYVNRSTERKMGTAEKMVSLLMNNCGIGFPIYDINALND